MCSAVDLRSALLLHKLADFGFNSIKKAITRSTMELDLIYNADNTA